MNKILVENQTFDTSYQILNVTDNKGNIINNFIDLYDMIENVLLELVDNLFRVALGESSRYYYVNIGGKSINLFINEKYLKKSFDFDVHLYEGDDKDIDEFGKNIEEILNKIITGNFPLYRIYFINILKRYNLITNDEEYHYKENKLFYYGERQKTGFSIKGIFIHFIFKRDLILGTRYTNRKIVNAPYPDPMTNELFYPISDFDLEEHLNFGLQITDARYFFNSYDNVKYAKYIVALHNVIMYTSRGGFKMTKNLNKLIQFKDTDKYTCYSLKEFSTQFNDDLKNVNIMTTINNVPTGIPPVVVNGNEVFTLNRPLKDILQDFINTYMNNRDISLQNCKNNLILDHLSADKNRIFNTRLTGRDIISILSKFEENVANADTNRYILYFTGDGYTPINTLNNYRHFGLEGTDISFRDINLTGHTINYSNTSTLIINYNEPIRTKDALKRVADSIDSLIKNIRNDPDYKNPDGIGDEFTIYRMQNFMCINSPNGDQFNVSIIEQNMVIFMPMFLSSSFRTNYSYQSFLLPNTFLFRIKIKKTSPNWIILNTYSQYPTESEILINRNCFLVVQKVDILPVTVHGNIRDLKVIDVILCDTLDEAINITTGSVVRILNIHDEQLNSNSNMTEILKNIDLTDIITNIESNTRLKRNAKICINENVLLFDDSKKDDGRNGITLISDMNRYHNLLDIIGRSESIYKSTTYKFKTIFIFLNIKELAPIITGELLGINEQPIIRGQLLDIIREPKITYQPTERVAAAAGGGSKSSYYHKYKKYKNKYLLKINQIQ